MNAISKWYYVLPTFLTVFGFATLREGGSVLFFDTAARAEAGNYVPFVLWFNFIMGFFYIVAGIGAFFKKDWSIKLALFIAAGSAIILVAFFVHVFFGGLYEKRTLVAMPLRTTIWTVAYFLLKKQRYHFLKKEKKI